MMCGEKWLSNGDPLCPFVVCPCENSDCDECEYLELVYEEDEELEDDQL